MSQLMTDFFRVMGNEQRLRIAVALMDKHMTASDLAQQFDLKTQTVLEHLAALRSLDVVKAQDNVYHFDVKALYALNKAALSREGIPTPVDDYEDEAARIVLRKFFNGQRLITLPDNPKKFYMLVNWLVTQFEIGVQYTEKQVNEIIERYHEDYATLRRAIIDTTRVRREKGIYTRYE